MKAHDVLFAMVMSTCLADGVGDVEIGFTNLIRCFVVFCHKDRNEFFGVMLE